jgi:antitoxin PrlF
MAKSNAKTRGARATMTSKGQVTIPKVVRERLGLKAGTRLHFTVDPTGRIVATPLNVRIEDLIGFLPKPERSFTIEEINEGIAQGATESATRGL